MTQPPQNPGGDAWGQQPPAYGSPSHAPLQSGSGGKGRLWAIIGCVGCGLLAAIAAIALIVFFVLREPAEDPTPSPTETVTTEPETTEPETTEPATTEPETTEPETTEPATTEPETTEPATTEPATTDPATTAAADVTPEDEAAAKQRFLDFITALGAEDYAGACGYVLDPATGGAFTGASLDACEQILIDSATPEDTESYKALAELITVDDIDSAVGEDGSITLTVYGSEFPLPMVRANDGLWYVDVS